MSAQQHGEQETIGRRIAAYRKQVGIRTAGDLVAAIGNPAITLNTIQNVESGRKADLSVAQLLDIAKALDIPPVALIVPIDELAANVTIPGAGAAVASMTNWELIRWFTDGSVGATRAGQRLRSELSEWVTGGRSWADQHHGLPDAIELTARADEATIRLLIAKLDAVAALEGREKEVNGE